MLLLCQPTQRLAASPRLRLLVFRPPQRPSSLRTYACAAASQQQAGVRSALAASPATPTADLVRPAGSSGNNGVLLLGEGDFSFCRASAPLHSCLQFTATSLEAEDEVRRKWGASAALDGVRSFSNVTTMHGIDATKLDSEPRLRGAAFDRVLFTFPHCGVKGQIHRNRDLLARFFRAVPAVLAEGGQVEVTLARGQGGTPLDGPRAYGDTWQVQLQAAEGGFVLGAAQYFDSEGWRGLGYSSRGCYRGLGRGTMEVGFRTDDGVVHTFVREDGRVASPYPQRHEFDMSLWVTPEWGISARSVIGDGAVSRFTARARSAGCNAVLTADSVMLVPLSSGRPPLILLQEAVRASAEETLGAGVVERIAPKDVWCRPADGRVSVCLGVSYCAPRKALTHNGAVAIHESVKAALVERLRGVQVRTRADALEPAAAAPAGPDAAPREK